MTPLAPLIPTVIDFTKAIVASGYKRGKKGWNEASDEPMKKTRYKTLERRIAEEAMMNTEA